MSIKYKKIKQTITNKNGITKDIYYARACKRQKVGVDEIAKHIASYTSLSGADVHSVLYALSESLPHFLLSNNSVELGDLGTFSLHFTSETKEKEEELSWRSIKDLSLKFRASKQMKKLLRNVSFRLVK